MLVSDQGQQVQGGQMPDVSDKDCAAVKAAFAKHPDAEQKLAGLRSRVQSGELDFQAVRAESHAKRSGGWSTPRASPMSQ